MKAAFYTLGCKVNQTESEYMAELLSKAGFQIVSPNEEADFYIIKQDIENAFKKSGIL